MVSNVSHFEFEHGAGQERYRYNTHCLEQVLRKRQSVVGTRAGFHDLFMPVGDDHELWGVLVVGPFATSRPGSRELRERWHDLTLRHAQLSDPSFADYVAATLSTLTLEGSLFAKFEEFNRCFAHLLDGRSDPRTHAAQAGVLRLALQDARFHERVWEAARIMVDARTPEQWWVHEHETLAYAGLERLPAHVVVGLLVGRGDAADPLDEFLRRDAFQRAHTDAARRLGNVIAGRIGNHGVMLLYDSKSGVARTRTALVELVDKVAARARRFGFRMHVGISDPAHPATLSSRYLQALHAAERSLAERRAMSFGELRPESSVARLRQLRDQLAQSISDNPDALSPRFERYIEAVLAYSGYEIERVRAQLEVGLGSLAEPLLRSGALDARYFEEIARELEHGRDSAETVLAVSDQYRRMVAGIESVLRNPTRARQDRSFQRALEFVREHLGEPLGLGQVARIAGFAPGYFSKLFKREQGVTFEHHVRELRIERAKHMLLDTSLTIERIRRISGFRTKSAFFVAFHDAVGQTPHQYRQSGG